MSVLVLGVTVLVLLRVLGRVAPVTAALVAALLQPVTARLRRLRVIVSELGDYPGVVGAASLGRAATVFG